MKEYSNWLPAGRIFLEVGSAVNFDYLTKEMVRTVMEKGTDNITRISEEKDELVVGYMEDLTFEQYQMVRSIQGLTKALANSLPSINERYQKRIRDGA